MASKETGEGSSIEAAKQRNVQMQEAQQLQQLIAGAEQKLVELKEQAAEHERVLGTLNGVEETRKAFRLIGGVLVERTVGEVKPAVEANKVQIESVVAKLSDDLATKRKRFFELKSILGLEEQQQQQQQQGQRRQAGAGVLV